MCPETGESAGKGKQGFVQLIEVRVQPIVPGTPTRSNLIWAEADHSKIVRPFIAICQPGKLMANVSGGILADHAVALFYRKNRSQHPLVFCVRLAKIKVWHTVQIIREQF
jgi:hypothetical protein